MSGREIPAVYMRGGTSRALMFHRRDLPPATADDGYAAWTDLFLTAIGSPDPQGRQLNGIGGGISSLSKVAIIAPSSRPDADVDYTFGQVGVFTPTVGYRGNCGNISSAVGPFAVDEGLVEAADGTAVVRIHNTNTSKIIRATFPVRKGRAALEGEFVLAGVAGTGAPIKLDFFDPAGAATGKLLPSGNAREVMAISDDEEVEVSLIDAANPVCFARASDFGLTGREEPGQIAADASLMKRLIELRVAAAVRMGMATDPDYARVQMTNLPLVCLVSKPKSDHYESEKDADLVIRMLSMDQPHKATPLTGALCVAAAAGVRDSLVSEHLADPYNPELLRLCHPTGTFPVAVETTGDKISAVTVFRTARRIMRGSVDC
jgi:2-methylaconitate cis-trans-isomerase PrpF